MGVQAQSVPFKVSLPGYSIIYGCNMKNISLCAIMLLALNSCKKEKDKGEPAKEKTAF